MHTLSNGAGAEMSWLQVLVEQAYSSALKPAERENAMQYTTHFSHKREI